MLVPNQTCEIQKQFRSDIKANMTKKQIIFVSGKNPNPEEVLHRKLLWRTLMEGVRRADSSVADTLQDSHAQFHLINWNDLIGYVLVAT